MRKAIGALAALGVISLSTAAFAQGYNAGYRGGYAAPAPSSGGQVDNIGNQGQFVIGAERITALSFDSNTTDFPSAAGGTQTNSTVGIALLGNSVGMGGITPASIPRLGFDYFVIDGLSLGTSLAYAHMSAKSKQSGQSQGQGSQDTFLFAPRVGYALQFGNTFSLWPRAGITYTNISVSYPASGGTPSSSDSTHFVDLTLEALFGISPVSHFVIFGGPYADLGLGGSTTSTSVNSGTGVPTTTSKSSIGEKSTSIGLTFGIAGYI